MSHFSRHFARWMGFCLLMVAALFLVQLRTQAAANDLFISEYIEGTSNNKAIEIYNGTGSAVDLGAGAYALQLYFNGATTPGSPIALSGTIADGDVFVFASASANATILAQADLTTGAALFNGDDAIALVKNGTIIDVFGQIGTDPGSEWGTGLTSTADNSLRRKATICAGDTTGSDAFDPSIEWDGFATDTFDGLGTHTASCGGGSSDTAPTVTTTAPAANATGVAINASITLTFSEAVNLSAAAVTVECPTGTPVTFSGLPASNTSSLTLTPTSVLPEGAACTVTVVSSEVTDVDADDPPDIMAADSSFTFTTASSVVCGETDTPIGQVQGTGNDAVITGQVTVQGVVVGDYEGASPALRGFYLQDSGDGNPATSDGIFVFNSGADNVALGDVVQVTGTAAEFQGQTQLAGTLQLVSCNATETVTPVELTLPFPAAEGGVAYLERFESMLVKFPQTLYVTEHFQLGRFGQVVVSSGDRLYQPTSIVAPGTPAADQQAANNLNRIIVDDALNNQNADPIIFGRNGNALSANNTLRGGDTIQNLVGLLNYTWAGNSASPNAYRVRPLNALGGGVPNFQPANPQPAAPMIVGGRLKVVSMNMLNYFTTLDTGPAICGPDGNLDCRGAESAQEFTRQRDKIINALAILNADVAGLVELENNASASLQDLVDGLNSVLGAGTYTFIDTGTIGTDAIKVGLIYKPAKVAPVGAYAILDSSVDPAFIDTKNRPALAQTFAENSSGARFTVAVNHLKSKGSDCNDVSDPDVGDGQGNCNLTRTDAATALAAWLATDPTGSGDSDYLIVGDLNSYAMEDPITALKAVGYADLAQDFVGEDAYSYVFDGQWGYLDYALANPSLLPQVTGFTEWHINADEPSVLDYNTNFKSAGQINSLYAAIPFRTSDHDPVVVGLNLTVAPPPSSPALLISPAKNGKVGSLSFKDEDIIAFEPDTNSWHMLFDGSDVGLGNTDIDAFTFDGEDLLLSFETPVKMPVLGLVDDSDIVRFVPQTLGNNTVGTFALYFQGASIGLTTGAEDIDAMMLDADGNLIVSTMGSFNVNGLTGGDEDLFLINSSPVAAASGASISRYFDGSDVGLTQGSEDVTGAWHDGSKLYLTTKGNFSAQGSVNTVGGNANDIFTCTPFSLGETTDCTFAVFFGAAAYGFRHGIDGIAIEASTATIAKALASSTDQTDAAEDRAAQFEVIVETSTELDAELDEFDRTIEELSEELDQRFFLPFVIR